MWSFGSRRGKGFLTLYRAKLTTANVTALETKYKLQKSNYEIYTGQLETTEIYPKYLNFNCETSHVHSYYDNTCDCNKDICNFKRDILKTLVLMK